MKLHVSSRLAIFALLELAARPEQQLSVAEIGEKYGVSSHHLAKVMHVLGRAGLVRSARGAGGGYQFSGNARRMTLLDVILLFETLESQNHDPAVGELSEEGHALREVMSEIDDIIRATLGSITIATLHKLVRRQRERRPRRTAAAS
ncbi:MAG: Rrf2 family transcriptional regulator [Hyphomicrobiaceae bacterium]|nr:MAG: Rrf2 family transcriptional regulator [Hyphomicrobiaceae bacterium]